MKEFLLMKNTKRELSENNCFFYFTIKKDEEYEQKLNNEILEHLNPEKTLYCYGLRIPDYICKNDKFWKN